MKLIEKGIILAHLQFPAHNRRLLENVEKNIADEKRDYLISPGDFMDMNAISHHAM